MRYALLMAVVSKLSEVFGPNDHREGLPHFIGNRSWSMIHGNKMKYNFNFAK